MDVCDDFISGLTLAWRQLKVPDKEDVQGLEDEYGDYFSKWFAGLSLDEVDRQEVSFLPGSALVFMEPYAASYYLGVCMLLVVEALPDKIQGKIFMDHLAMAQTYNAGPRWR